MKIYKILHPMRLPPGFRSCRVDSEGILNSIRSKKSELRHEVRERRKSITDAQRRQRDIQIHQQLTSVLQNTLPEGSTVTAFAALPGEPGGEQLPVILSQAGFNVLLPFVISGTRELEWRLFEGMERLASNKMGILQPTGSSVGPLAENADLAILPALSIGHDGTRLGQGGGYYDQQFAYIREYDHQSRLKAAWAIIDDEEIDARVPADDHDLQVQAAVTPSGFRQFPLHTSA